MKLLVIIARGLRATATGPYGNRWLDTPTLDVLASRGIVFDWHFADRADAPGAHRAWRSGRYDLPLSEGDSPSAPGSSPPGPDLLDQLRARGVATRLVADDSHPVPQEFLAGWDKVDRVPPPAEGTSLEAVLGRAAEVLEELAGKEEWLLWVDVATLLPPWSIPDEFLEPYFDQEPLEEDEDVDDEDEEEGDEDLSDEELEEEIVGEEIVEEEEFVEEEEEFVEEEGAEEEDEEPEQPLEPVLGEPPARIDTEDDTSYLRLSATYAAAVSYLDAGLGSLLEALTEVPGGDEAIILITADQGYPLGEHEAVGTNAPWLHAERLHLPLLVHLPGGAGAGRRVASLTQSVDLAPTLASLFEVSLDGCHGVDLLALVDNEGQTNRPYVCSGVEVAGQTGWVLRTPDRAFLTVRPTSGEGAPAYRLFIKPDDAWEVNDNSLREHDHVEQLERALLAFLKVSTTPGPWDPPPLEELPASENGPEEEASPEGQEG